MTPKLDYVPRLVEANRAYRVTAPAVDLSKQAVWWTGGVVLDQGQEGSCVGHGVVGEYLASPVRGRFSAIRTVWPNLGHELAVSVYDRARKIDEFEGDFTEGTSVRAGMLVGRERGWYSGFNWAFNMTELRAALQTGPVVIGVTWNEHMYEAPKGIVTIGGFPVGGHCLVITGYTPRHPVIGGPAYRWRNSWGLSYGVNGSAYISDGALKMILFDEGGEAAVPIGRAA